MTKEEMEAALDELKEDLARIDLLIENLEVNMRSIAMDYSMILTKRRGSAETIDLLSSLLEKLPADS